MKVFICDCCNEKIEPESPCKVKIKYGNYINKYTYCKQCADRVQRSILPHLCKWEDIDIKENFARCPACCKYNKFFGDYCKWCGSYNVTPTTVASEGVNYGKA